MIIDNVKVYTPEKKFVKGGIILDGKTIKKVYTEKETPDLRENEVINGNGSYAIPGLIDLHFHGCKGMIFVMHPRRQLQELQSMKHRSV